MLNLDMEVKLEIGDKKFEGKIRSVMGINEANLTDEFISQPSTYAWFATLSEIASAEVESRKFDLSVLEANLDKEKREVLAKEGKITETMIKSAVTVDKRFIVANQELNEIVRQQGILKAFVKALDQRKDMLIQLGSTKRQEMLLGDFGINLRRTSEHN